MPLKLKNGYLGFVGVKIGDFGLNLEYWCEWIKKLENVSAKYKMLV
jgi:hypothetical protein